LVVTYPHARICPVKSEAICQSRLKPKTGHKSTYNEQQWI